jgi:protein-tyrosine phosphatase
MIEIVEGLYLGNREAARDLRRLKQAGITHIVNCAVELPNYHQGEFVYLPLGLLDPDPTLHRHFLEVFSFIDDARGQDGRVLVHCFAAISRSPSVVLAYLCHIGDPLEEAARKLGALVWCDPDVLHLEQLARHLKLEYADEHLAQVRRVLQGRSEQG